MRSTELAGVDALPTRRLRAPLTATLATMLLVACLAIAVGLTGAGLSPVAWVVAVGCGAIISAGLARGLSYYDIDRLGPADRVTLARAALVAGVAALVADSFGEPARVTLLVSLAAGALMLDAVDGWVARRTRTTATLGAHFDAEVDAFLILVLSVYVSRSAGPWVLAIGAARYAFLAAGWALRWLREPLPPRYWRKFVAATQGIVLTVAAAAILPPAVRDGTLIVALVLLAESFGRDVWWLRGNRRARPQLAGGPGRAPAGSGEPPAHRSRGRRAIGIALTILSALLVWAVLVAPDQPQFMSFSGFLRIPLELPIVLLLAMALPRTPRRIMAVIAGVLLTLMLVLKAINYEVFVTFARPFQPIGDTSQLTQGIQTLRSIVGSTETTLIEVGAIVGIAAGLVLLTLAMLRLTDVAADNRRWATRAMGGVGVVWLACFAFGARFISHTPIASTIGAGIVVDNARATEAEIHDESVFAAQIKRDTMAGTPANRLLTALRGKTVLLVFVEAYGQQAVQGRQFSPEVDHTLAVGDKRLASAGFASRSGFLTSATYGGISWLAHSSLQSGLWVNSQTRYNQLLGAKRFTLADAFKKAGWRTVDDVPSNDIAWPQGKHFYHYDTILDRYQVGYKGPTFTYASMPDQYIFKALQQRVIAKPSSKPLFAEVDTVSSHMPWNKIPEAIPWNKVGDGSIYKTSPQRHYTGDFWGKPPRVQAAYGKSVVYAMSTLTSFIHKYGKKNLVVIALGDHQPLPIVSGDHSNHDVPISIISHDPKVLKAIRSWGWNPGLQPRKNAPVWPMSAFRNRFLTAFDSRPGGR